jgi:catalase
MAVKFRLDDGSSTDLLGQTSPRFPTDDPEVFVAMTEATEKPLTLPLFLATHPGVLPTVVASFRSGAVGSPASFAEVTFYPIHAYGWLDADGNRSWVRYTFRPTATKADRLTEGLTGRDRLFDEMAARLERGPVVHEVWVQVAGAGDDPHRATSVWKGARELLAGRIEVTAPVDDPEGGPMSSTPTVFDPSRVVDGIELSDDPILRYRPGAYTESVARRTTSRATPP